MPRSVSSRIVMDRAQSPGTMTGMTVITEDDRRCTVCHGRTVSAGRVCFRCRRVCEKCVCEKSA